jgi:DnaJ-class molecular chaperone
VCGATGDLATVSPIDIQKKAATEGISVEALIARLRGHHEVLKVEKCVNCNGTGKNSLLGGFRGESRCETCSGLGHVAPPELDEDSLDEVERLFDA